MRIYKKLAILPYCFCFVKQFFIGFNVTMKGNKSYHSKINFFQYLNLLKKGDNDCWKNIEETIGIIIRNWARKNNIELQWNENGVDEKICIQGLFKKLKSEIDGINNYDEFKQWIIHFAAKFYKKEFDCFMKKIFIKDNKQWKILTETLQVRTALWLKKRIDSYDEIQYIFSDGIKTIYENITIKQPKFNDSAGLKSYFFRILEFKLKEKKREKSKEKYFLSDVPYLEPTINMDDIDASNYFERILKKGLDSLSKIEKKIVTEYFYEGKKLKELAIETGLTEENIRIKKFRALKKLKGQLRYVDYGT